MTAFVKFDRQIVAIAKVAGATAIYTQDDDLARHARDAGLNAQSIENLPDPPTPPQIEMILEPPEAENAVIADEE